MLYDHDHHCILVKLSITNVRKNKLLFAFKHGVIHGQFISVWHYVEKGYDLMASVWLGMLSENCILTKPELSCGHFSLAYGRYIQLGRKPNIENIYMQ